MGVVPCRIVLGQSPPRTPDVRSFAGRAPCPGSTEVPHLAEPMPRIQPPRLELERTQALIVKVSGFGTAVRLYEEPVVGCLAPEPHGVGVVALYETGVRRTECTPRSCGRPIGVVRAGVVDRGYGRWRCLADAPVEAGVLRQRHCGVARPARTCRLRLDDVARHHLRIRQLSGARRKCMRSEQSPGQCGSQGEPRAPRPRWLRHLGALVFRMDSSSRRAGFLRAATTRSRP